MSTLDSIDFVTLERLLSTDLNAATAIKDRFLADLLRRLFAKRSVSYPFDTPQNVVVGGFEATPNGTDVDLSAGILAQTSVTLSPAVGPYDSTYRLARTAATVTVVMPAPGATTYYLIEAQMAPVVTLTANRDVYNPGTETFTPVATPVVTERQIVTQIVAGGPNAPAPSGGDWVPIAIVRRPGGGGPVVASDIIDVRTLATPAANPPIAKIDYRTREIDAIDLTNAVYITADIDGEFGRRAFAPPAVTAIDPTSATYLSPATVLAASTRFYLYLAPWSAALISPRYSEPTLAYEGVLVLSSVAPNADKTNSGPITLPAPFGVVAAGAGTAYYVGTLIRNSTNTGWIFSRASENKIFLARQELSSLGALAATAFAPPIIGANNVPALVSPPGIAKSILLEIDYVGTGGGATFVAGSIDPTGVSTYAFGFFRGENDESWTEHLELPTPSTAGFDVTLSGGPIHAATVMTIRQVGWTE